MTMKAGENNDLTEKSQESAVETFDENVLVISAARNVVVLPYSVKKLQKILRDEPECSGLHELIAKKYTVPLSRYKHGCISRFRETFALVLERSKGSALKAFGLAAEMFFTRFLHPAIITACKKTEWLEVYLDCLDRNELDEFPFFEIRYEPKPKKSKRKSTSE